MTKSNTKTRNRLLISFIILIIILFGVYYILSHSKIVTTKNAYVEGDKITITSEIPGTIESVLTQATDTIKKGETLIQIDKNDLNIEQQIAESSLRQTINNVKSQYELIHALESEVSINKINYEQAKKDFDRRRGGDKDGSVLPEALAHTQNMVQISLQQYQSSQKQLDSKKALYPDEPILNHPSIQKAIADLRKVYLAQLNTEIKSPVNGAVAIRSAQVGEEIQPGQPLLAVVSLDKVWVTANFKETQLKGIKIGQKVNITSDLYGSNQIYHGIVSGIGAGTGSVFSALPAENATGNWIKIVQRIPVRIELDPKELKDKSLHIGMSMSVSIDTSTKAKNYEAPLYQDSISSTYQNKIKLVDQKVKQFIQSLNIAA